MKCKVKELMGKPLETAGSKRPQMPPPSSLPVSYSEVSSTIFQNIYGT